MLEILSFKISHWIDYKLAYVQYPTVDFLIDNNNLYFHPQWQIEMLTIKEIKKKERMLKSTVNKWQSKTRLDLIRRDLMRWTIGFNKCLFCCFFICQTTLRMIVDGRSVIRIEFQCGRSLMSVRHFTICYFRWFADTGTEAWM